jgi:hypothetical protein
MRFSDYSALILSAGTATSFSALSYHFSRTGLSMNPYLVCFLAFCACDLIWLCIYVLPFLPERNRPEGR